MSVLAVPPDVEVLWLAALSHAGIDPADAVLYAFAGTSSATGFQAKVWRRGDAVNEAADLRAFEDDLNRPNEEPDVDRHRVAVWLDHPPEVLAGLIRHELEHALQLAGDPDGELDELHWAALVALNEAADGAPRNDAGQILGGGELYNLIPMEVDANAAAASFVRAYFGDDGVDRLLEAGAPQRALLESDQTPELPTIHRRMRDFVDHGAAIAGTAFVSRVAQSD